MEESKQELVAHFFRNKLGISVDQNTATNLLHVAARRGVGGYVQWMTSDDQTYFPASQTRTSLAPGIYEIDVDMNRGLHFTRISASTEDLVRLSDTNGDKVIREIRKFWESEAKFRDYGISYKRGIFMHGPPGSGKTSAIRMICSDVISLGGIVIKFTEPDYVSKGLRIIRDIQPNMPIVILMEDLDSLISRYIESEVINLLDGVDGLDKVVFLATSNYPEKLGERVVNRPSRFDRRYYIGPPNAKSRSIFFRYLMTQKGQTGEKIEEVAFGNLAQWVADTEGMSIAHLKELFVAVNIIGTPYAEALEILQNMSHLPSSEEYSEDEEAITDHCVGSQIDAPALAVEPRSYK